jgi:hypothetical protein
MYKFLHPAASGPPKIGVMRDEQRPRRYLPTPVLTTVRPLFRYSGGRDAYVLRVGGNRIGPVLKRERRRGRGSAEYAGPDRRGQGADGYLERNPRATAGD